MNNNARGVSITTGKLVYGQLLQKDGNSFIVKESSGEYEIIPVFNAPIMRCVRTMTNGTFLFEHDIVYWSGYRFIIGWDAYRLRWLLFQEDGSQCNDLTGIHKGRILGNPYETDDFKTSFKVRFCSERN